MVLWNTERLKIIDDGFVKVALCIKRSASKCVNADVSIKIWLFSGGRICKAVGFMHDETNIFVTWDDFESFTQGHVNCLHESNLLFLRVLSSYLN